MVRRYNATTLYRYSLLYVDTDSQALLCLPARSIQHINVYYILVSSHPSVTLTGVMKGLPGSWAVVSYVNRSRTTLQNLKDNNWFIFIVYLQYNVLQSTNLIQHVNKRKDCSTLQNSIHVKLSFHLLAFYFTEC